MRKRNIGNEFHAAGSSIFQLLSRYAVKDTWTGGLSCILITVSQRGKGSTWITWMYFCFCQCFIWRTQKTNTTGGHKSHLCFPIITNWNTNKWLFDSLFVFPIEWHQTKKQKTSYTRDFAFLFSFFTLRNETMYNGSYLYFPFFVYELGKRKKKTNLPFFYILLLIRKTKNERTIYTAQRAFPFFLFSSCKRKKRKYV